MSEYVMEKQQKKSDISEKSRYSNNYSTEQKPNNTGIPDELKTQFECAYGYSLEDVLIHYNSNKPEQIGAYAYTQGDDVYIASGQEQYLPHELGHVIQQKRGNVKPTINKENLSINLDLSLEHEADDIAFFARSENYESDVQLIYKSSDSNVIQMGSFIDSVKLDKYLDKIITYDIKDKDTKWYMNDKSKYFLYLCKAIKLLDEIYEVDYGFLHTMTSYMGENIPDSTWDADQILAPSDRPTLSLSTEETDLYLKKQKLYILASKQYEYLTKVRDEQELIYTNKFYINEKNKRIDLNQDYLNSLDKYIKNLNRQIAILELHLTEYRKHLDLYKSRDKIIDDMKTGRTTQQDLDKINQDIAKGSFSIEHTHSVLLTDTRDDGKVDYYTAIMAPSMGDRKDIVQDQQGAIKGISKTLQIGGQSPVRAFSWYSLYMLNHQDFFPETMPLIRRYTGKSEELDKLLSRMIEEDSKSKDDVSPNSEDIKIANQFGLPNNQTNEQEFFSKLDSKSLVSIGDTKSMSGVFLSGGGQLKDIDAFKEEIGFGIYKVSEDVQEKKVEFVPSKIHFFDKEHTAFHKTKEKGNLKDWGAYSYRESSIMLEEMKSFFTIIESDKIYKDPNNPPKPLTEDEVIIKLKDMLEANKYTPFDLFGDIDERKNSKTEMGKEEIFAANHMKHVKSLTPILNNLLIKKYLEWINSYEIHKPTIIERQVKLDKKNSCILEKNTKTKALKVEGDDNKTKQLNDDVANLAKSIKTLVGEIKQIDAAYPMLSQYDDNKLHEAKSVVENSALINEYYIIFDLASSLGYTDIRDIIGRNSIYDAIKGGVLDMLGNDFIKLNHMPNEENFKFHIIEFLFRLLRLLQKKFNRTTDKITLNTTEKIEVKNRRTDSIDPISRINPVARTIGDIVVPADRFNSDKLYERHLTDISHIYTRPQTTFMGGVSGTTRDITVDTVKGYTNEKDYWQFQLINSSFMILNKFHSFFETIQVAAIIGANQFGASSLSQKILDYLRGSSYATDKNAIDSVLTILSTNGI